MWNSSGQLSEARTPQTLCHFEYDEAGLLIGEQQSLLGQDAEADKASSFALRHHYDALHHYARPGSGLELKHF